MSSNPPASAAWPDCTPEEAVEAVKRVRRLLAAQEAYCGDTRLDVPSWVRSVRQALDDE